MTKWIITRVREERLTVEADTLEKAIEKAINVNFRQSETVDLKTHGEVFYVHNDPKGFGRDSDKT